MGCLLPSRTRCLILALVFCGITSALADTSDQQTPAPPPALVSITDSNASQLERQADQLCQQKRYLDAMDYYNAALTKEPTADRYNKLGMSYIHMQRFPEAEKSFEHALKLDKNSAAGYNNRGWIYQKNGNYGRAIKYFKKALALKPTSSTFHYNLGAAYFAKHDIEKAAAEYRTAYQLDPDIFERVSRVGIMIQSSSPEDRAAFSFMVAKMYAQSGDFEHSLEYLRKAMEQGYKDIHKVYTDSEFATLRTDKRFSELMMQKPQPIQ